MALVGSLIKKMSAIGVARSQRKTLLLLRRMTIVRPGRSAI
jgi:ribosomal protein L30/L7E